MGPAGELFLSSTSPFSVAGALGYNPTPDAEGEVRISCPSCRSNMYVTPAGFLCSNNSCDIKAANAVDFTAAAEGHLNYEKALNTIRLIENIKPQSNSIERDILRDFKLSRKIFSFFRSATQYTSLPRTHLRISGEGWLRKQGYTPENIAKMGAIWTSKEVDSFNKILLELELQPIVLSAAGYALVVPFFSSYSSVGAILIAKPGIKDTKVIRFTGEKYLWSGLLGATKPNEDVVLSQNFAVALKLASEKSPHLPGKVPLGVMFNPKGFKGAFCPKKATYLHYPELEPSLLAVSHLDETVKTLAVLPYHTPKEEPKTWDEYVIVHLLSKIKDNPVDNKLLNYIDSCRMSFSQKEELYNSLLFAGEFKKAQEIKGHFGTQIIITSDKYKIRKSPEGYFAQDVKTGERTDISNFSIEVIQNIIFPTKKEILTECAAYFGTNRAEFLIPTLNLDNPNKLEEAVRIAWITTTTAEQESLLPIIKDKNLYRKFLAGYLKDEAAKVPSREGIAFLGWTQNKQKFIGPGWEYENGKRKNTGAALHKEIDFLKSFLKDNQTEILLKTPPEIPREAKETIYMLLANICRGALGLKTYPISYETGPESLELLSTVFGAIGQISPYSPTQIRGSEIEGCRDYPFFSGETRISTQRLYLPMFHLAKDGKEQVVEMSPDEKQRVHTATLWAVQQTLKYIQTGNLHGFSHINSVNIHTALKKEGARILENITHQKWELAPNPYEELDQYLQNIPTEKIKDTFILDVFSQSVILKDSTIQQNKAVVEQFAELATLKEFQNETPYFNMVQASSVLQTFYQTETLELGRLPR
jgi:hypothetical protein